MPLRRLGSGGMAEVLLARDTALGEDVAEFSKILEKGTAGMEKDLFDGEYFMQKIQWKNLKAKDPTQVQSFGGGYSYKLSALASFFVEARYHYVWGPEVNNGSGGTKKANAQFFPITFGFRF